jgi:hypothetical protein
MDKTSFVSTDTHVSIVQLIVIDVRDIVAERLTNETRTNVNEQINGKR